jgi:hypothetical protein
MAGFRRRAGPSDRAFRFDPVWLARFSVAGPHCCFPAKSASPRVAFALLRQVTPPCDPFGSPVLPDPPSLGAFAPDSSGSPLTSAAAEPLLGLGPRFAAGPCGPQRIRRLSVPLQPDSRPGPKPGRRVLSETPDGPSRGGLPAFIDSRSGLSHQPNISVRVGIPLKRLAGG